MAESMLTLRIPRNLWKDLEETVIQQDRQFLSEVARSLGLPVPEVLRRCLGTGVPQPMPVLWCLPTSEEPSCCPWWECHGDGLWRRCPRLRVANTLPCAIHERCVPCPLARLDSDPHIRALGWRVPVRHEDVLYWVDPDGAAAPFTEDGTVVTDRTFRRIRNRNRNNELVWTVQRLASGYH
jgi:hypothetical protein